MKVVLLIDNPGGVVDAPDTVYIDPYATEGSKAIEGDISDLSHTVDDGEAQEIHANEILDYYPGYVADRMIDGWVKKLAIGGEITITSVDLREVARSIGTNQLSLDQANELLHGKQDKEWNTRKATFTVSRLAEVLNSIGLKIMKKRVHNFRSIVVAKRVK